MSEGDVSAAGSLPEPSRQPSLSFADRTSGPSNLRGNATPGVSSGRNVFGPTSSLREKTLSFATQHTGPPVQEEDTNFWGSGLQFTTLAAKVRRFLREFTEPDAPEPKYPSLLKELALDGKRSVDVDCQNLHTFDSDLYRSLVNFPSEVTAILDDEAKSLLTDLIDAEPGHWTNFVTKPFNLIETTTIRDLNPSDMNKLIAVNGMVTRTSNIIPELSSSCFKCVKCGHEEFREVSDGMVDEPVRCGNAECKAAWTMSLQHNFSVFCNKQTVRMQENPTNIPEGETPHALSLTAYDEMVDAAKPGDRVTVTGIYKATSTRVKPNQRTLYAIFNSQIHILHMKREEKAAEVTTVAGSVGEQEEDAQDPLALGADATAEQMQAMAAEMKELAAQPDIYEKLIASIAPGIWELDDVKKGILCQLFGGNSKEFPGGKTRGEINVLLVGDPGTSKSQMLGYVHQVAPRGMYTSGQGSSAVGLTAYVSKDPQTREMVLESGALVLSDKGICCIDEFDKMSDSARSMLHEVMEQQTVSVAKAGIVAQLNARTSVLASANPVGSRYNPRMSVVDNINLPPSLLSRFDLIYLVLDKVLAETDIRLGRHLCSMFYRDEERNVVAPSTIPLGKLKQFIKFARATCRPQLTEAASELLVSQYLQMRNAGISRRVISATPRQLESMIRIAEALAKMRLSETVEGSDVEEAGRLVKVAMQQSATDPITGAIDMDIIQTGMSHSARIAQQQLADELRKLIQGSQGKTLETLLSDVQEQSSLPVDALQIQNALALVENLVHEGGLYRI